MTQKGFCLLLSLLLGLAACTPVDDFTTGEIETEEPAPADAESTPVGKPQSSTDSIENQLESAIASNNPDAIDPNAADSNTIDQPTASQPNAARQSESTDTQQLESDCQAAATQIALNECAQQAYEVADAQLNQTYRALKEDLSGRAAQALTTAELAWIAFRDSDCTFVSDQYEDGSIAPLIHSDCLRGRTQTRTDELREPKLPASSYQTADKQLNERYQALLNRLSGSQKQEIADVQLAWIEYRDRNCDFEVLYSTNVIEETQCLARMSEARAAELQGIIEQRSL